MNPAMAQATLTMLEGFILAELSQGNRLEFNLATFYPRLSSALPSRDSSPEAEVHSAPEALLCQIVVNMALPAANRGSPPVFPADVDMHGRRNLAIGAFGEIRIVDGRPRDKASGITVG